MKIQRKLTYSEAVSEIQKNLSMYKKLYIERGMSAKKVAENQNIFPDNNWAKALCRLLPKNMGHGGARQGAGNKKGIRLKKTDRA